MRCPAHSEREAVSACSVCGRPVCEWCLGQIDRVDYCPAHFELAEARLLQRSAYGLAPLPISVSATELLLGVWAGLGAIAPWLPWYRVFIFSGPDRFRRTVDVTGWEAGGIGAVASLALLVTGLTVGAMIGVRIIRDRLLAREPMAGASMSLGLFTLVLVIIRVASRADGLYVGLYLALTSSALVAFLGRRLRAPT
jgi:hypothetical protein